MTYKIIADSCCEFPKEYENDPRFEHIPLCMEVEGESILDDETFNQGEFLKKVAASKKSPKSSCPSPERYREAYCADAECIFVFTLSSKLSGSYNSAVLAKSLYHEKYGDKKIFVCDTETASVGETQLALRAASFAEQGLTFEEICDKLIAFRDEIRTYFVLDNIETLRKNGRMSGVKALVASTLSIKPILAGKRGEIVQAGQAVGIKKALIKMTDIVRKDVKDHGHNILMISHCNCQKRAEDVKNMLMECGEFVEVRVLDMAGISSMYANDGGVIVTY